MAPEILGKDAGQERGSRDHGEVPRTTLSTCAFPEDGACPALRLVPPARSGRNRRIGVPRFELGTSPTRTERATKLRHTPEPRQVSHSASCARLICSPERHDELHLLAARSRERQPDRAERADREHRADDRHDHRERGRRGEREVAARRAERDDRDVGRGERDAERRDRTCASQPTCACRSTRARARGTGRRRSGSSSTSSATRPASGRARCARARGRAGRRGRARCPAGIAKASDVAQEPASAPLGRWRREREEERRQSDGERRGKRELAREERVGAAADADGQDQHRGEHRLRDEQLGDALDVAQDLATLLDRGGDRREAEADEHDVGDALRDLAARAERDRRPATPSAPARR